MIKCCPHCVPQEVVKNFIEATKRMKPRDRSNLKKVCFASAHQHTLIKVLVPLSEFEKKKDSYQLMEGWILLTDEDADYVAWVRCFVACSVTYHLHYTREDVIDEHVDLVPHLDRLLPHGEVIGLITCQNGIQNEPKDFHKMCKAVINKLISPDEKIERKPLFIGIHNPTNGLLSDVHRLNNCWLWNCRSSVALRQVFATLGLRLEELRPQLHWAHIAHSEAGYLAKECLTNIRWGLIEKQREVVKKHLITLIYGGVDQVPDATVKWANNTYSLHDVAMRYARPHLDTSPSKLPPDQYPHESKKNGRSIRLIKCISEEGHGLIPGDHGFLGTTYQKALGNDLRFLHDKWRIVN